MFRITIFSLVQGSVFQETEKIANNRIDSGDDSSESKKRNSVQLRPALEIESAALYYICMAGGLQQTAVAESVFHTSIVEMANHV